MSHKVVVKLSARQQLFQGTSGNGKSISKLTHVVVGRPWGLAGPWPKASTLHRVGLSIRVSHSMVACFH